MKKNTIKLNESQLRQIVKESVKKVLKETIEGTEELNESKSFFSEYLPRVIDMFNEFYHKHENAVKEHIIDVKEKNDYNNFEKRIAYDIARALKYWEWDFIEKGNDNHIKTLFVAALRKSDIPYNSLE